MGLTVTDSDGATDFASQLITVTAPVDPPDDDDDDDDDGDDGGDGGDGGTGGNGGDGGNGGSGDSADGGGRSGRSAAALIATAPPPPARTGETLQRQGYVLSAPHGLGSGVQFQRVDGRGIGNQAVLTGVARRG